MAAMYFPRRTGVLPPKFASRSQWNRLNCVSGDFVSLNTVVEPNSRLRSEPDEVSYPEFPRSRTSRVPFSSMKITPASSRARLTAASFSGGPTYLRSQKHDFLSVGIASGANLISRMAI